MKAPAHLHEKMQKVWEQEYAYQMEFGVQASLQAIELANKKVQNANIKNTQES